MNTIREKLGQLLIEVGNYLMGNTNVTITLYGGSSVRINEGNKLNTTIKED